MYTEDNIETELKLKTWGKDQRESAGALSPIGGN